MSGSEPSLSTSDAYTEIGANYRYFLGWMHKAFAGYVAILAGLSIAFWEIRDDHALCCAIAFTAILLTGVFYAFQYRNRFMLSQFPALEPPGPEHVPFQY